MNEQDLLGVVKKVLVEEFEVNESDLLPESNLYEDLGLDSLDSVDLVVALEKEFKFKVVRSIDEEKIREIRTVTDICDFVEHKIETSVSK